MPVEFITPAPAVDSAPEPVVEDIALTPTLYASRTSVNEYIALAPVECLAPAPAIFAAFALVIEYVAKAPEVHIAPAPAVYTAPARSLWSTQEHQFMFVPIGTVSHHLVHPRNSCHSKVPVETCCIVSGVKLRVMCIEVSTSK